MFLVHEIDQLPVGKINNSFQRDQPENTNKKPLKYYQIPTETQLMSQPEFFQDRAQRKMNSLIKFLQNQTFNKNNTDKSKQDQEKIQ